MYKKNRLVCGVGINDLVAEVNVKGNDLPFYNAWRNMLNRCYLVKVKLKYPTYIGCTVCNEWKYLSNFKVWYDANYREGFQLDKDILIEGNKVYSSDTCCFIPQYLNLILNNRGRARGNLPLGITTNHNSYIAQCNNGCGKRLTKTFKTIPEAHEWYSVTKKRVVAEQVQRALDEGVIDNRIANALLARNFC